MMCPEAAAESRQQGEKTGSKEEQGRAGRAAEAWFRAVTDRAGSSWILEVF